MRYVINSDVTPDDLKDFDARNSHLEGTPDKPIRIMGDFSHDFRNVSFAYVSVDGDQDLQAREMAGIMESVMRQYLPRVGNAPVDVKISRYWSD